MSETSSRFGFLNNIFGCGCNDNTIIWIVVAVVVLICFCGKDKKNDCGCREIEKD